VRSTVPAGTSQYEPGSPARRRKGLMLTRTENTLSDRTARGWRTHPPPPALSFHTDGSSAIRARFPTRLKPSQGSSSRPSERQQPPAPRARLTRQPGRRAPPGEEPRSPPGSGPPSLPPPAPGRDAAARHAARPAVSVSGPRSSGPAGSSPPLIAS